MTTNHRMKAPSEMATEVIGGDGGTDISPMGPKAVARMKRICATPAEVAAYHYSPNQARRNLRPGIPVEESRDSLNNDTYSD